MPPSPKSRSSNICKTIRLFASDNDETESDSESENESNSDYSTSNDSTSNDSSNSSSDSCDRCTKLQPQQQSQSRVTRNDIQWVEKYRPQRLDDIIEHEEIRAIFKKSVQTGELPNLLLYGPPGTGKTSTILALARELYGPYKIKDRVIELNASDDCGINVVRCKIISFAKISIGTADPNYPSPKFKIVILDEADSMTSEAQAALRKVMEKMSKITRFCFICNYVGQIIGPIISRCTPLKFKAIRDEFILDKIRDISKTENLNISEECLATILDISEGDARAAIMNLQNVEYLIKYKKTIVPNDIYVMNGDIDRAKFSDFWAICSTGTIMQIRACINKLIREGYTIESIFKYLMDTVLQSKIPDKKKATILTEICNIDKKLADGCDEYIQLLHILTFINGTCNSK